MSGADRDHMRRVLAPLFTREYGGAAQPAPDGVLVSIGGNAITSHAHPHLARHDDGVISGAVLGNIMWLLGGLVGYRAPTAKIIVSSLIPRRQQPDADLSAFKAMSERSGGPRCVPGRRKTHRGRGQREGRGSLPDEPTSAGATCRGNQTGSNRPLQRGSWR